MSLSSSNVIFRADGGCVNECNNVNNENNGNAAYHMLNNNGNEMMNEENAMQNESVVLERRTDRQLKHKGNLDEIKREGQCKCRVRTCMGSEVIMT